MKTLIVFRISFKLLLLQVFARNVLLVQHYTAIHCTIDNNTLQITTLNSVHHCTSEQSMSLVSVVLYHSFISAMHCTAPTLHYTLLCCNTVYYINILYNGERYDLPMYYFVFRKSVRPPLHFVKYTLTGSERCEQHLYNSPRLYHC